MRSLINRSGLFPRRVPPKRKYNLKHHKRGALTKGKINDIYIYI